VLKTCGSCDEDVRRLASDLMGVPPEVRTGDSKVPPADDVAGLSALAEREIERLRRRQECVLDDRDESRRSMAMAGMPYDEDAGTARLRRYESGIRRALNWAQAELLRVRAEAALGRETQGTGSSSSLLPTMSDPAIKDQVERVIGSVCTTPAEEAPATTEDHVPGPSDVVAVPVEATPAAERPAAVVPVVSKAAGAYPFPARTAAHRSATPRNRLERRAAESKAHKAERRAAKGQSETVPKIDAKKVHPRMTQSDTDECKLKEGDTVCPSLFLRFFIMILLRSSASSADGCSSFPPHFILRIPPYTFSACHPR
jgi:hypothetical protein